MSIAEDEFAFGAVVVGASCWRPLSITNGSVVPSVMTLDLSAEPELEVEIQRSTPRRPFPSPLAPTPSDPPLHPPFPIIPSYHPLQVKIQLDPEAEAAAAAAAADDRATTVVPDDEEESPLVMLSFPASSPPPTGAGGMDEGANAGTQQAAEMAGGRDGEKRVWQVTVAPETTLNLKLGYTPRLPSELQV